VFWFAVEFAGPLTIAGLLAEVCATPLTMNMAAAIVTTQDVSRFIAGILTPY
jgi:hypothetical protein